MRDCPPSKPYTCVQTVEHHREGLQKASGPYMHEMDAQQGLHCKELLATAPALARRASYSVCLGVLQEFEAASMEALHAAGLRDDFTRKALTRTPLGHFCP